MISGIKEYRALMRQAQTDEERRLIEDARVKSEQAWKDQFWERGCRIWPFLPSVVERLRAGDFKTLRDVAGAFKVSLVTASAIKRSILHSGRMTFPELSRCLPGSPGLTDLTGQTAKDRELQTMDYTTRRIMRNPGSPWSRSRGAP